MLPSSVAVTLWAVALRAARPVSRLVGWCTGGGRAALAGFALTAVAVAIFGNWEILAIYLMALLVIAAWHARRRIVIEEITDNTSDGGLARGAAALLAVDLARIGAAFRSVDVGRDIEMASGIVPLEIATSLEDFAADLRGAITAESTLSIGPISFPVGALMAVLGRFVQAPRLSAAIHDEHGHVLLIARLTDARRSGAWRVELQKDADDVRGIATIVRGGISELAYRVFTDVGLRGSTDWRATRHLVESVRHYRSSLRARGVSRLALLTAESELLEAIGRDPRLFEAYHDLGVVYVELDDGRARRAESAFRKAIEIDPSRWEPYYALAQTAFREAIADDGEIDAHEAAEILDRCRRVIDMRPAAAAAASAHNVIGLVQRRRLDAPDPAAAMRSYEIATRLSLRVLARAVLGVGRARPNPGSLKTLHDQTAICLRNLAIAYAYASLDAHRRLVAAVDPSKRWHLGRQGLELRLDGWRFRRIAGILSLAKRLSPANAELHFEHGKIALEWGQLEIAQRELQTATQICPRRVDIWLALARDRALLAERDSSDETRAMAVAALRQGLQLVGLSEPAPETVSRADQILESIGGPEIESLTEMLEFVQQLKEIVPVGEHREDAESLLATLRDADRNREAGVLCWLLGRAAALADGQEVLYREALARWETDGWLEDVRREGVHGELARILVGQGRFDEAIAEAQRGIGADALSQWDHARLGDVYYEMQDWGHARGAYNNALLLDPDNFDHHRSLGVCLWNLGRDLGDHDERSSTLAQAARHLEDGLALSEEPRTTGDDADGARRRRFVLKMHYELGRIYTDADRFAEAISHLLLAATSRTLAPLMRLYLGQAYRFADNLDTAREQFEQAMAGLGAEVETIGAEVDDECPRDWLLAWLHEELARIGVERDGDQREAKRHLARARHHAKQLDDPRDARPVLASCSGLQGKVLLREGDVEAALLQFQAALRGQVDAESYVDLARAYEVKASLTTGAESRLAALRGRDAAELAVKFDLTGRVAAAANQMQARLDRLDARSDDPQLTPSNGQPSIVSVPGIGA